MIKIKENLNQNGKKAEMAGCLKIEKPLSKLIKINQENLESQYFKKILT